MLRCTEGVEVCKHHITLHMSRVGDLKMLRIGKHAVHLLLDLLGSIRQINAIAEGLAHLGLSVSTGKTAAGRILRKNHFRNNECLSIDRVELMDNFTGLLDHRSLIYTYRNGCSPESCNVRCLTDRICKESHRRSFLVLVIITL